MMVVNVIASETGLVAASWVSIFHRKFMKIPCHGRYMIFCLSMDCTKINGIVVLQCPEWPNRIRESLI